MNTDMNYHLLGTILPTFNIKNKIWWKVALIGLVFSSFIELSQLVLKRGLCETDDVIHNTVGCVVGYIMGICLIIFFYTNHDIKMDI